MATKGSKIYITISDKRGSGTIGQSDTGAKTTEEEKEEKALSKYLQHQFFATIKSQTKQAVRYAVNNIGNFTGDYQTQRQMQSVVLLADFMVDLGTSAYTGFKLSGGNPVGAMVAVGINLATSAINLAEQNSIGRVENKRLNYTIDILRQRSGLDTLTDGSRGTEN